MNLSNRVQSLPISLSLYHQIYEFLKVVFKNLLSYHLLCFVALARATSSHVAYCHIYLIETLKLFRIFFKCLENQSLILLCNDIHHHITDNNIKIVDMRQNRTDSGSISMSLCKDFPARGHLNNSPQPSGLSR